MRASLWVPVLLLLSACPPPGPQGLNNWCVSDGGCLPGLACYSGIHDFCFFGNCGNPGCLPTEGCGLTASACCDPEHLCAGLCCGEGSRCETMVINGGVIERCSAPGTGVVGSQ